LGGVDGLGIQKRGKKKYGEKITGFAAHRAGNALNWFGKVRKQTPMWGGLERGKEVESCSVGKPGGVGEKENGLEKKGESD